MKSLKIIKKNDLKDWAEELFQKNSYKMVDVSSKKETFRRALATGKIFVGKEVFSLSSVTNKGLEEILNKVLNVIKKNKQVEEVEKWSP